MIFPVETEESDYFHFNYFTITKITFIDLFRTLNIIYLMWKYVGYTYAVKTI